VKRLTVARGYRAWTAPDPADRRTRWGFPHRFTVPVRFDQSTGRRGAMKKILILLIVVAVGALIARQIQQNHQG
jgi:hypothetical protein